MEINRRFDIAVDIGILLVFIVTVYMTKDFLSVIPLSIVLIYLLKPVYAGIFRLTRHEGLSSFFSLMVVFAIILAILIGLSDVLLIEISNIQKSEAMAAIRLSSVSSDFIFWMDSSLPAPVVLYVKGLGDIPAAIAYWIIPITEGQLSGFVSSLPILFAESLIAIIFTYYMLIDGRRISDLAVELIPETKRGIFRRFLQELDRIYTTLFTVYFTTAIISGSMAALGFYLLGIPYPLVWGTLVSLLALIPFPGPPLVYVPMAIYYFMVKDFQMGIIILVFGALFITLIPSNIIAPQLALKTARIHPILTLLAFIAPIFVLGIVGVILGPMFYGLLLAIYRTEMYYRKI
jgi:predicted PurR-regulated permease PerM